MVGEGFIVIKNIFLICRSEWKKSEKVRKKVVCGVIEVMIVVGLDG